ncbi:sn-glycerol-3-phosphate ABC transporter ATP-binding protein UgpC [Ruficoccus amylovorans]|uniref:sn-glycerol-3-phosphate ABC transporter ATP-binding protein UgpC n=1 Tax=Ruficoccus amylovorans TaxID=1804625 RepID=A0A842HAF5_9BACT|nr:sn-glycerol-3-phosphate ABC transporter ATP-binding protein UgpC [Ruficoccus amylovorans]MBC2593473.1 sn-glycerol-3-phosphate ABC transporter ATP-binding protein UgpC [Ruficoccus amylovorans]
MANVSISKLTKTYPGSGGPDVTVVHGIDLEIRDGEFMVLVGPSGCGKSTTLRMIAGLEDITGGSVSIGDRVVNNVLPKERDIAMVFQNYALYPHMSVYENMAFGLKLRKFPKAEIDQRVREASAMLGLDPYLARKPKALSGGQRQRVAVGRAIVRKPKVFLFDEPLSNLDAKMRVSMRAEISKLHARLDATMIYVTHDQVEAMTMGDRICVMKDGRIMQVDEPLALYNKPDNMFVAGFIGSPAMNFFKGTLRKSDGGLVFAGAEGDADPVRLMLPEAVASQVTGHVDREVVLGIRPEDISEATPSPDEGLLRSITARLDVREPMGAETYLYCVAGGTLFVARVHPGGHYECGQQVKLHVKVEHIHLFDAQTEQALLSSLSGAWMNCY